MLWQILRGNDKVKLTQFITFFYLLYMPLIIDQQHIIYFIYQMTQKGTSEGDFTSLQSIMKRDITSIMEYPSKDQIYDNVSFKLGAFYKRFWQNKKKDDKLKQNTHKAGQIIGLAQQMRHISRQDDRLVKVCAYARQVKKFVAKDYQAWKHYIWADLSQDERVVMENYVQNLAPPIQKQNQPKVEYDARQKERLFGTFKYMKKGMLLVQVFEKIWTIRKYRQQESPADVKRHQKNTTQILEKMKEHHSDFRAYLCSNMGSKQWKEIQQLW